MGLWDSVVLLLKQLLHSHFRINVLHPGLLCGQHYLVYDVFNSVIKTTFKRQNSN
jgi:hypothetical protein